ncbi:MAG: DUF2341 domain-containing protein [Chitinivibrionales bacterium]|nr:DUF2341 domain-containing protein [Chitinivibrionales bacterium]
MRIYLSTSSGGADIAGNVLDFSVLVKLVSTNFDFSQTDSAEICFTKSNGSSLKCEVEQWDIANAQAAIWVKVDTVYGNNRSQYIVMHWGDDYCKDGQSSTQVFDTSNGFIGVWHMKERDSTVTRKDATGNANHATVYGGIDSIASGATGIANYLAGGDEYLSLPFTDSVSSATVSLWFKFEGTGNQILVSQESWDNEYCHFKVNYGENISVSSYPWPNNLTGNTLSANIWYYAAYTFAGNGAGNWKLYEDGDVIDSSNFNHNKIILPRFIGHEYTGRYFNGYIDEVRIEKSARSADWIKLCYQNQKANQTLVPIFKSLHARIGPVGVSHAKKLLEELPNKILSKLGIIARVQPRKRSGRETVKILIERMDVPISYNGGFSVKLAKDVLDLSTLSDHNLNERQMTALKYIKEKHKISNKQYQQLSDVSKGTATKELAAMVRAGLSGELIMTMYLSDQRISA